MTFQDVSIHFSIFDCVHENLKLKVCFYGKQGFWAKRVICMKQQQHKGLKLTQMIFWGKSCTGFFAQKVAQNEFSEFSNKLIHWVFWSFIRTYCSIKAENWVKHISTKYLCWDFEGFLLFFLLKPSWLVNCDCELKVCFFLF